MEQLSNILFATVRVGTPLVLAALAALISQQVNLINIAVEGLMLIAAFAAIVLASVLGNVWAGLLFAVLTAVSFSLLFCFFVINLRANLIVSGLALNTFAVGMTAYLLSVLFGQRGFLQSGGALDSSGHSYSPAALHPVHRRCYFGTWGSGISFLAPGISDLAVSLSYPDGGACPGCRRTSGCRTLGRN